MCEYVTWKELRDPRDLFASWITNVQKYIKKKHKIHFEWFPIGSVSRNLVIERCDNNFFDLDYQIHLGKSNGDIGIDECKKIKYAFKDAFDAYAPKGFTCCEDSTQALTTKNNDDGFGYDIIITRHKDNSSDFYILINNKNKNNANNNDYGWAKQSALKSLNERLDLIAQAGAEAWNDLRNRYKKKRHDHKNDKEPKKEAYQLLNEAAAETLQNLK